MIRFSRDAPASETLAAPASIDRYGLIGTLTYGGDRSDPDCRRRAFAVTPSASVPAVHHIQSR